MKGFTLIEVLIAMTLFSMMVVLLFGSLQVCANSWHKGETKIAAVNEMAVVSHFFQQHLATTQPLLNTAEKNAVQAPLAFQGKRQSLQFSSAFPASVGRLGVQLFTISLKKEDGQQNLKVNITPLSPLNTSQEHEEVDLLRGVSDVAITYFGSDDGLDNKLSKNLWREDWLEKKALPRLIKITIKLDNGLFFPDMLIALKITEPPVLAINNTGTPNND
ncbi:MAG: prepilin-type N-terminal cleavage/methylation domain-containing protein [Methylococcales bacterium]|nr:prepilin-type N-terminal cleavage/methylation domain-containing protein [Methylococcales bacterium]